MSIHQVQNGFSYHICIGNKLYFVYQNQKTLIQNTHTTCHMNQLPISDYMDTVVTGLENEPGFEDTARGNGWLSRLRRLFNDHRQYKGALGSP